MSSKSMSSENLVTQLERMRGRMAIMKNGSQLADDVRQILDDLRLYIQTNRINEQTYKEMHQENNRLKHSNEAITARYHAALQNIQMLIYQKDFEELKERINQLKCESFEDLFSPFTPRLTRNSLEQSKLDCAFVLDDSLASDNQFLEYVSRQQKNSKVKDALSIISGSSPFEKKEEVWLQIMYSKNLEESCKLNHVDEKEVMTIKRNQRQVSEFSLTQEDDPKISKFNELQNFAGKKIKSLILLKQRSSKKPNKVKTSIKKGKQHSKQKQNAQSDQLKVKKKLQFCGRPPEAEREISRRKGGRQSEIKAVKSFRKTLISNL